MNISDFAFRLLIVFFPGIIAHLIVDVLTEHKERTPFYILLYSFVLGMACYVGLWACSAWFGYPDSFDLETFFKLVKTQPSGPSVPATSPITATQIGWATVIAIPLSLIVTVVLNYKLVHRLARFLRLSHKMGDLDVWNFLFTSQDVGWIAVRDFKNNLYYEGWVDAFSPTFKENELLLRDVEVFRSEDGVKLYNVDFLYLARESNELTIESLT